MGRRGGVIHAVIAVSEVPRVSERVAIWVRRGSGEGNRLRRGGVRRARAGQRDGRLVGRKGAEVDGEVEGFWIGVSLSHRRDVKIISEVAKGPPDGQRMVVFVAAGTGGHVDQLRRAAGPAQVYAVHERLVRRPELAELQPIRIAADAVQPDGPHTERGGVDVMGVQTVNAAGGRRDRVAGWNPIQPVLEAGAEMPAAAAAAAHGVERIAVFLVAAGADGAAIAGLPPVGVTEAEVVAELMRAGADIEVTIGKVIANPADIAEASVTVSWLAAGADEEEVVFGQVVAEDILRRGARFRIEIGQALVVVEGDGVCHAHDGRDVGAFADGRDDVFVVGDGRQEVAHVRHVRERGVRREDVASEIREVHAHEQVTLAALGVAGFGGGKISRNRRRLKACVAAVERSAHGYQDGGRAARRIVEPAHGGGHRYRDAVHRHVRARDVFERAAKGEHAVDHAINRRVADQRREGQPSGRGFHADDFVIAGLADPFLGERRHRRRELAAHGGRDGQRDGPLGIGLDEVRHLAEAHGRQSDAFGFERTLFYD